MKNRYYRTNDGRIFVCINCPYCTYLNRESGFCGFCMKKILDDANITREKKKRRTLLRSELKGI